MGQPSATHSDALSDETLAEHLAILRDDPAQWRSALGTRVLTEAKVRYARLATACGLDAGDGATYAWSYWTNELTDAQLAGHRTELWKYTGAAIRRHMCTETVAQSRLTSTRSARQVAVVGMDAPVRFNSAEELARISSSALVVVDPFDEQERTAPPRAVGQIQAISAVKQLLVMAGLTAAQRDLVLDEIARHVTTSVSVRAAAEAMRKNPTPSVPMGTERWRALSALVLGTEKGSPGLIHLIGGGHPAPMNEPHIRRLLPVFLQGGAPVAAGVA